MAAAAGLTSASPAAATACSGTTGVSLVVDFGAFGGGVQTSCAPDGAGQKASSLFPAAGYPLSYVQNEPGFVCRVAALPSQQDEPCVNTPPDDAYWGLWWSDGKSGNWSYSNYGATSLKVPDGAWIGFAWKQGSGEANAPRITPKAAPAPSATASPTPSPTPTKSPTGAPTKAPTGAPTGAGNGGNSGGVSGAASGGSASAAADASAGESASEAASESASESADAAGEESDAASSNSPSPGSSASNEPGVEPVGAVVDASADSAAGMPDWLPLLVIASLFGAAATVVVVRRRAATPAPGGEG